MAAEVKTHGAGSPHLQPWSIQPITLLTFRKEMGVDRLHPTVADLQRCADSDNDSCLTSLSCDRWQGMGN